MEKGQGRRGQGSEGDQEPRIASAQVSQVTGARKHMVGIGLIPLSSLVTEGALVFGWAAFQAWELLWISLVLLGVIRSMCSSQCRDMANGAAA